METVNYKLLSDINKEILEAQANQEKITYDLKKISNNSNLKYLNFKVIGISALIGLVVGASAVSGYAYYKIKTHNVATVMSPITAVNPLNKGLTDENEDLKKQINGLKNLNKKLAKKIGKNEKIIKKMKAKILPSEYYCNSDKKFGLCVSRNDYRYSEIINFDDNADGIFIEIFK